MGEFGVCVINQFRYVSRDSYLGRGVLFWDKIGMGCVLFYGVYGVLKLLESMFDIDWQGNFNCAVPVVPYHRENIVLGSGTISGDFVLSA